MTDELMETLANDADTTLLPFWVWSATHPQIVGEIVEDREITTAYGPMEGSVIEVEDAVECQDGTNGDVRLASAGDRVIVWRKNATLKSGWSKPEPHGGPPEVGERVGVKHVTDRKSEKHGTVYPIFRVAVARAAKAGTTAAEDALPDPHNRTEELEQERQKQASEAKRRANSDADLPF